MSSQNPARHALIPPPLPPDHQNHRPTHSPAGALACEDTQPNRSICMSLATKQTPPPCTRRHHHTVTHYYPRPPQAPLAAGQAVYLLHPPRMHALAGMSMSDYLAERFIASMHVPTCPLCRITHTCAGVLLHGGTSVRPAHVTGCRQCWPHPRGR
jgi:hypothetical protein